MSDTPKRKVLLHGTDNKGKNYLDNFNQASVIKYDQCHELDGSSSEEGFNSSGNIINSILIITAPGDNINSMTSLHELAKKLNILITTIIIDKSTCNNIFNSEQLSKIRKSSDMVIFTSDDKYMEYMIECMT